MGKALNNAIYYTVGSVAKALASFLLLPVFANILGAAQYGVLNLLQTFSVILSTVMSLALDRSIYRLFYDYHTDEDISKFLSSVFWLICINSLLIIVITMALGQYLVQYLGDVDVITVLLPVVLYTFLSATISFSLILMQVEQNGRLYLFISLLFLVIYNFIAIILVVYYLPTIQSLVYATLISNLIVAPVAFFKIRKKIRMTIDISCVKAVFKYSSPILLMMVFAWLLNFSDRLFIANMSTYSNVGVYSIAAKFVSVISILAAAIFQAYGPYFFHMVNTIPETEAKNKLKGVNSAIIFIVCLLCIIVVLFSKTVLGLFFSDEYSSSLVFIYLLSFSMLFSQQNGILNLMVLQNKKTFSYSVITIVGGAISVILNALFIPVFGAVFAAVSNLIVSVVMITMMFILAKRNYYIDFDFKVFSFSLLFIFVCIMCDMEGINHWYSLIFKILLFSAWSFIGWRFSIIKIDNLKPVGLAILNKFRR